MCHSMNLYERVDENRLRNIVSISEEQFVFVKGKSTTDARFALRQLQERYREGQQDLHRVFNYLEKKNIRQSPEGRTVLVHAAGTSEPFAVEVGLHQGPLSVLSCLLS